MTAGTHSSQVRPLLALRWRMVRSKPKQVLIVAALVVAAALAILLLASSITTIAALRENPFSTQALVAYPVALLLFLAVAIIAPFLAGGAIELFPPSQLVAYPINERTRFAVSLLLMPFNVTWMLQVVLLVGLTVVGTAGTDRLWSLSLVTLAFIVAATITGQALAWVGTAVRQTRAGRWSTNALAAGLAVLVAANANQEALFALADRSPLLPLLGAGLTPGPDLVAALLALLGLAVVLRYVGIASVRWTLRLGTETAGLRESQRLRRRATPASAWSGVTRSMLRSVTRSRPIRRGLVMLVLLPVVVAGVADLEWTQIVVLPGLVAAGAALLFGVNGFSLLGGGAAWLGSTPMPARTLLTALLASTALVIGGATAVTTTGVALFAPGLPNMADLTALLVGAAASAAWVTATAVWLSVKRPYQADLRGNRDTPAPPGVMAGYSLRLAGTAGVLGLTLVVTAELQAPRAAIVVGAIVLAASAARLAWAWRRWSTPRVRSRALLTTAFG